MNLHGRIPVEPLSDERMTNLERRVVIAATDAAQAARAPRARMRWLGVAVAAAAIVVAGVVGWRAGAGGAASSAPAIAELAPEAPIRVDTMQGVRLDIGDAVIASDPATKFVVTRPAGGVLVEMTRGKVELEVGTRGDRPALVVRAGDTDVVVVGTRFSVDYGDGTGEVIVIVTEGVVRVVKRSAPEVRLAAGQAWTTSRGPIAASEVAAAAQVATSDDGVAIEIAPDPVEPPRSGSGSNGRPRTRVVTEDPRKALLKAPIQPAHDLGIANPRDAIMAHLTIAGTARNAEASRAQYSVAVLQKLALKDSAAALKTLEHYFERFSHKNKAEHADALWLRVRILCEKTFDDACRRAARMYSSEAPSTSKSGIADRILVAPP